MLAAIDQFIRGTMAVMYQVALLQLEVFSFCKVNEVLSKRRRAKKTCVQFKRSFIILDTMGLLGQSVVGGEGV